MKSNTADGTAALVDMNNSNNITIGGNIQSERFLEGFGYHYVSTLVPGLNSSFFDVTADSYQYDETMAGDDWLAGWQTVSGSLVNAKGYALFNRNDLNLNFTGTTLNSGDISIGVTLTSGSEPEERRGWNLVGNPYPSAIDADLFIADNVGTITGTIYFWEDADSDNVFESSDYASWNGAGSTGTGGTKVPNGYISSNQGFMVKALSSGNVNFDNSMRTVNNSQYFKNQKNDIKRLNLSLNNNTNYSEILIAFKEDANLSFDELYDGIKLKSNNNINLFTELNDQPFGIQTYPSLDMLTETFIVPLVYESELSGEFVFTARNIENFEDYDEIFLFDKESDNKTNLINTPQYSFNSESGIFKERFELIFKGKSTGVETNEAFSNTYKIYSWKNNIVINTSNFEKTVFKIYNITGSLIESGYLNKYKTEIQINNNNGIYIVELNNGYDRYIEKLIIMH